MSLRVPAMLALAIVGLGPNPAAARCLEGPYRLGAVPKHPMTPMHTAKPRNPLEEPLPRCTEAAARERGRERLAQERGAGPADGAVLED